MLFRVLDSLSLLSIFTALSIIGGVSISFKATLPLQLPNLFTWGGAPVQLTRDSAFWMIIVAEHALLFLKLVLDAYVSDVSPDAARSFALDEWKKEAVLRRHAARPSRSSAGDKERHSSGRWSGSEPRVSGGEVGIGAPLAEALARHYSPTAKWAA